MLPLEKESCEYGGISAFEGNSSRILGSSGVSQASVQNDLAEAGL